MIRRACRAMLLACLLCLPVSTLADNMIMGRVAVRADIAMAYVQTAIEEHGYTIAHVQLCDGGMTEFGYKSDLYRVVFFGKIDEVRRLSQGHPELASYLPLKIAVIAERDETLLTVLNPDALAPFFADEAIQIQLGRWRNDLQSIFDDVRRATAQHGAVDR